MLEGVMLLWFVLTAAVLLFVAVDIRNTPGSPVLKWDVVLLTAYTGVVGGFLYVLGCREPLPGLHEQYVAARWRQVLGSTMHCVAGDGVGIIVGAILASLFGLKGLAEVVLEYILGFAFGWTIFQALFMRDMVGGSYPRALKGTFISELVSMNLLMTGMVPTVMALKSEIPAAADPTLPSFWFVMSMGLLSWLYCRLSDELVAGGQPAQARHDDSTPGGCRCGLPRPWRSRRRDRLVRRRVSYEHERRSGTAATGAGDGAAVVRSTCGRRGHRLPIAANIIPVSAE